MIARALLDMADDEIARLVTALQHVSCGCHSGSAARIIDAAEAKPVAELSPKMRHAVIRIAHRYRKQLPEAVLPLFLRFSREQLTSRAQDYTWQPVALAPIKLARAPRAPVQQALAL